MEQALELQSGISTTPGGILIYGFSGNQALYIWYNMYAIQLVSNDAKKINLAESVYDYGEVVYYTATAGGDAAVEHVQGDKVQSTKFFRDGQLLIEKNGKIYNAQGMLIEN